MAALVALALVLVSSSLAVTEQRVSSISIGGQQADAAVWCGDGEAVVYWAIESPPLSLVLHELAHLVDCADDGKLNGSPSLVPFGEVPSGAIYRSRCFDSMAEWYACEVTGGR